MPTIIRNTGDPRDTRTLHGKEVHREQSIYLKSHNAVLPVLQTSMHFCYRDASQPRGTTLFCTCGSPAIIVGYEAYRKYNSYIGNEVIACYQYIQYGKHADGSSE